MKSIKTNQKIQIHPTLVTTHHHLRTHMRRRLHLVASSHRDHRPARLHRRTHHHSGQATTISLGNSQDLGEMFLEINQQVAEANANERASSKIRRTARNSIDV